LVWLCELGLSISLSNANIDDGSFEPTIVAGLGYAGNQAQLMSVPPFAAAFVCTYFKKTIFLMFIRLVKTVSFISAILSDRYQCRGYTTIFFSLLEVIGFIMFYGMLKPCIRRWCLTDAHTQQARRTTSATRPFFSPSLGDIVGRPH
jgi:hypothetical protein